jgi:hypothetical protein
LISFEGVNAGLIAGIIIALLVVVAIGVVIFAWRTSRMCFAGKLFRKATASKRKRLKKRRKLRT